MVFEPFYSDHKISRQSAMYFRMWSKRFCQNNLYEAWAVLHAEPPQTNRCRGQSDNNKPAQAV